MPSFTRDPTPYGIEDAVRLMRSLPVDKHVELVVSVFRTTLASMGVPLRAVIDDATRREAELVGVVRSIEAEIETIEASIGQCHGQIAELEAEYAETTAVKHRLLHLASVSQGLTTTAYTRFDL